jgi:hypothetical protein
MSSETVTEGRYDDMLPEGAYPTHGLRVISYISADGSREFRWEMEGSQSRSECIGDLMRICYMLADDDETEETEP